MMKSVKELLFASSVSTTNLISDVVGDLRMSMSELEEKSMRFCKNLLDMTNNPKHGNRHGNNPILASAHG